MITVRFFAMLRNLTGAEGAEFEYVPGLTVGELKAMIKKRHPGLGEVLDRRSVMVSVNQEFATDDLELNDGDEVALLPPFSGG